MGSSPVGDYFRGERGHRLPSGALSSEPAARLSSQFLFSLCGAGCIGEGGAWLSGADPLCAWLCGTERLLPAHRGGVHVHQRLGAVPVDPEEVRDAGGHAVHQRGEAHFAGQARAVHEVGRRRVGGTPAPGSGQLWAALRPRLRPGSRSSCSGSGRPRSASAWKAARC